ncbi:MAG: HPr family phosphocarrier protein [Gammaproteobacteria bacterium]|jgi:phosphocarrier protein|nr:HPr family phosphocarrier protein [Gammaproteobacteria bacterium]MCP4881070.1 HPr family phosphocarrier protein [Gammaproteobacteria bacterium]MDP6165175.1 HPr family phosphocarrier protein [Gammaproteobacteria bacterium]
MNDLIESNITIINKLGLHARAAAKLVGVANKHACEIEIGLPEKMVNAKSIMSVMLLAASKGTQLNLRVRGENAHQAHVDICAIINNRFDEDE